MFISNRSIYCVVQADCVCVLSNKHELYCNKDSFLHLPRFRKKIIHISLFFRFLRL